MATMHQSVYHKYLITSIFCAITVIATTATAADWPQFRGPNRDNISKETGLLREWPADGPKVLWTVEVGEGYAAAAIVGGRVYFNDYDKPASEWLVRCLNLEDGTELWRFKETRRIRPNHGITRTVPATDGKYVFSLDPKATFHALEKIGHSPRYDMVIFDSPAHGHGLDTLALPRAIVTSVPSGQMREEARIRCRLMEDEALTEVIPVTLPEEGPGDWPGWPE